MTDGSRRRRSARPSRPSGTTRPRPSRATSSGSTSATATSSAASGSSRAETYTTIVAGERGAARRGRRRRRPRRSSAPSPPRARRSRTAGRALPGSERAKYLFRIARILQERSREFAVLESLNGGKPIKESRDVDLPLAAAHFFYYAGWADKLEYAFPNRRPRPLGVAGQIIPWNFPLLMLAWKIAPALAAGNTVVLKPAETTPLTALLFCDVAPAGGAAAGRRQHRHRRRPHRRRARQARCRQDRVHRLDRGRQGDPARARRHRQEADARARRQGGEHRLRRRRARPGGRGDRQRHLLQPGPRLLRRLAAASCRSRSTRTSINKLKRRMGTLRVGDPLDKNTDVGAINSRQQLEKIKELVAAGEEEGAEIYQPPCRLPEKGYWFAPTVFTNVAQSYRIAQEEIFGPVLSRAHLPHAGRGGREGEQHAVRAERRRLDGEGLADPLDGGAAARRRRLGEHVQPLRPGLAVRRLQGVGLRPRGRPARARAVPEFRRAETFGG